MQRQHKHPINLSIIIPVYNCANWIMPNLEKVITYFSDSEKNWELIVVDDGSTDDTTEIVQKYFKGIKCTSSLIKLEKNVGKGGAVITGLRVAKGNYRLFMDCDLAYPLTEATKIIKTLYGGADVAIANRRIPGSICELDPQLFSIVHSRELYGRILNKFIRILGLTSNTDTQAGLKGFRSWVIDNLSFINPFRFAFDIEILHLAECMDAKIVNIPIRYQFFRNVSSITLYKDGFRILIDIIKIKIRSITGHYKNLM